MKPIDYWFIGLQLVLAAIWIGVHVYYKRKLARIQARIDATERRRRDAIVRWRAARGGLPYGKGDER